MLVGPSPLAGRPLRTRADIQAAVRALWAPLPARFSPGAARVRIGVTGANFSDTAAELEGFSRPLWGLVPMTAGGGAFDDWNLYQRGLTSGSDPDHPEYWGETTDIDQRFVEMAAIGLGLALVPEHLWLPLDESTRRNLARWLNQINQWRVWDDNWHFFRVLVNLGLSRVGAEHDLDATHAALDRIEEFYLGDGWYSDGPMPQQDYYVAWAMHFYGLLYAQLHGEHDPIRAGRFRERAATFAHDFIHWFAADGAALPFGRSLTYRFAQGAFWGALAFAGVEALPWGIVKGLWLRNLRWWAARPIANSDRTLTIGYAYPNLNMAEDYNSPGSPYWAMKTFLPLALPESHPFWQAEEAPLPGLPPVHPLPHAGMIVCRDDGGGHVFALGSGQHASWVRHGEAKYAKFAYSTAFGFSVPAGQLGLERSAYDSALALSEDGIHYRTREDVVAAERRGDALWSRWRPWPGVEIETWLVPAMPWHVRIHRLRTDRRLSSAEGGWAVDRTENGPLAGAVVRQEGAGAAIAVYPAGWSGLRDLRGERLGRVVEPSPNTNVLHPRTVLPVLIGEHEPGEHWLVCAVVGEPGQPDWERVWNSSNLIPGVPKLWTTLDLSSILRPKDEV